MRALLIAPCSCAGEGRVHSWPSLRLAPDRTSKITFKAVFVYVHLVALGDSGWPASTDGLTVILVGFNNGRAGRMAPVRARAAVAALNWCGGLPGIRASAAAAVRCRAKNS